MSKRIIDIGFNPNDGLGDTLRDGGSLINDNFNEIYGALGIGTTEINIGFGKTVISIDSNSYNVGFGSTQPKSKLDVVGNAKFTGIITASSFKGSSQIGITSNNYYIGLTTNINLVGSGVSISYDYNNSVGITTVLISAIPGISTAAGSNTNIQYNTSGNLAGSSNFTFDGSKVVVGSAITLNSSGVIASGIVTSNRLVSTTTSLSPISVASSILVTNLNANYLSGLGSSFYQNASNLDSGTISGSRGVVAGSLSTSFITYNAQTKTSSSFYGGTSNPSNTTRLNYDGYFYATRFYGDGSGLTNVSAAGIGLTIYNNASFVGVASALDFGKNINISFNSGITSISSPNIVISSTTGNSDPVTYPVLVGVLATGDQDTYIDSGFSFNAVTNALTAGSFNGNVVGTSGTISFAVGTAITYTRGLFTNIGINTTNSTSSLTVGNDVLVAGVVTAKAFYGKFNGEIPDGSVTATKMSGIQTGTAPTYAARAFLVMDGASSVSGSRIIYGQNISNAVRNGSGLYEVTFQTPMHTDKYCVLATLEGKPSQFDPDNVLAIFDKKVDRFQFKVYEVKSSNNAYQDAIIINLVIFA